MRQASRLALVLAAVVLAAVAAGCGGDSKSNPTGPGGGGGAADVTVSIQSGASTAGANAFSPDTAVVQVGQTIKWVNNDTMVHTATDIGGSFNTGNISAGASSAVITISGATGVRQYTCQRPGHNMTGWVNVTP